MSYIRPVKQVELVKWLQDKGFADETGFIGNAEAETLAAALIDKFDLIAEFWTT